MRTLFAPQSNDSRGGRVVLKLNPQRARPPRLENSHSRRFQPPGSRGSLADSSWARASRPLSASSSNTSHSSPVAHGGARRSRARWLSAHLRQTSLQNRFVPAALTSISMPHRSQGREVLTAPPYSCRATVGSTTDRNGRGRCSGLSVGGTNTQIHTAGIARHSGA